MSYNLTDNVNDSFEFVVNGSTYIMKFPLMEELEKAQELSEKRDVSIDPKEKVEIGKELEVFMYQFIEPKESSGEPIGEVLKKQNIKVLQNFNTMIQKEFGIQ